MNTRSVKKLSDGELNVMVAKLCGWEMGPKKPISLGAFGRVPPMTKWHRKSDGEDYGWQDNPRNYVESLDAMHEACMGKVKEFGTVWTVGFNAKLCAVLGHHDHVEQEAIHATARQRAEAFLLMEG